MNSGGERNTDSHSDVALLLYLSLLASEVSDSHHYYKCVSQTGTHR